MTDPEIKPGDRPPRGPHTVVHPDSTRQHVYGGPNHRPRLTHRQRTRAVWSAAWTWVLLATVIAAMAVLR